MRRMSQTHCHPETAAGHKVPEDVEGPPSFLYTVKTANLGPKTHCHPETAAGHEVPEDVEGPPSFLYTVKTANLRPKTHCHPETAAGHEVPEDVEGPPDHVRRFFFKTERHRIRGSFDRPLALRVRRRLRMTGERLRRVG